MQCAFPLATEKPPARSPCRWYLPYYLLQPLSVSVYRERACHSPASYIPTRSLFLKPLRPDFFPKMCRQPEPRSRRSGTRIFSRGSHEQPRSRGQGAEGTGARWAPGEPRSLCLRIPWELSIPELTINCRKAGNFLRNVNYFLYPADRLGD